MRRRATPRDFQFDNDYLDPPAPKRKRSKTASTSNNATTPYLCWKFQESALALAKHRKALFVREYLLGKYQRMYFWIGRSLVKLKEREEALMASSQALRIFDRVLMKNHKYNKWSCEAMESIFSGMMAEAGGGDDDGEDSDFEAYKAGSDASIAHERAGDSSRKMGQLAEAIAEYRTVIDTMDEEYHPDAADLYCKVAIILRQQGEFDLALEEYRFASEIYELSLGAEHPETVKTLNQLIEKKQLNQVSMALMEKLNLGK